MNDVPFSEIDLDLGAMSLEEEARGLLVWVQGRYGQRDVAVGFEFTNLDPTGAYQDLHPDGLTARSFFRPVEGYDVQTGETFTVVEKAEAER